VTEPFNRLTPAEAERLAMLAEECGEVVQAVTKILRHGYASYHPDRPDGRDNRQDLFKEVSDVFGVLSLMKYAGDIQYPNDLTVRVARQRKLRYAHHQVSAL
jgi:NTP pyrophosphatase (non-canonical NTP hydrolase)